jgi:hypothetical protein
MTRDGFWVAKVEVKISRSFVKYQIKYQIGLGNRAAVGRFQLYMLLKLKLIV